jgi:polygalacturonase
MVVLALTLVVSAAYGQKIATGDSRNISSAPAYPSTCKTLSAASGDQTSNVTSALSSCAGKGAVVLQTSGSNNTFSVKGFTMAANESLVVNSGVTLLGSSYSTQMILVSGSNVFIGGKGIINANLSSGNRVINTKSASNFTMEDITIEKAGKMNVYMEDGSDFTIWNIQIRDNALTPKNTDGIDIDSTSNTTVANSYIEDGDDCIAVKTNSAAVSAATIKNSSCHGTHGLSVGSQTFKGVSNILFENNYVYGKDEWGNESTTPAAIRIKTDPTCGGHVDTVTYINTCITTAKELIDLDPHYGSCSGSSGTPYYTNIVINGVYSTASVSGASSKFDGYESSEPMTLWLENIDLDNTSQSAQYATVELYNSNVTPSGTGVTTSKFSGSGSVPACSF